MELLRIGEEKLKIILTHEDLLSFEMEEADLDYTNTETKRMLWELLHQAKTAVGFFVDGHRVLVQLYPSKSGGCELFVTKLGALACDCPEAPDPSEHSENKEDDGLYHFPKSHTTTAKEGRLGAFCFETLDDLLCACRRLCQLRHKGKSYAYRSEDGHYYLFLDGLDATGYFSVDEYSFLHEYGTAQAVSATEAMLSEHGTLFCPSDAVTSLGVL